MQVGPHRATDKGHVVTGDVSTSTLKVEGLSRLIRDMTKLGVDINDMKDVMADIATDGANLVRQRAPHHTGALSKSVRGNRAKGRAVVKAGGARVPYAAAINYGWPAHGIRPARYMQLADPEFQTRAIDKLTDGLNRLIEERDLD